MNEIKDIMKKAIFIDGEHQYDLLEDEDTVSLFYSENGFMWIDPGGLAMSIKNSGNGFILGGEPLTKGELDYSQAQYLYILLAANKDTKISVAENFREI